MIAWDLETTRIAEGTPEPKYITAFSEAPHYALEMPVRDMNHLHDLIVSEFLREEFEGVKFVAWNSNNFDSYFVAACIIVDGEYTIRPYLTRSNALRGFRVILTEHIQDDGSYPKGAPSWEFLDGMAMLGLAGVSLEKFLQNFAPDYLKLSEAIDFSKEEFDAKNANHRAYAMRDSVGLYHAMTRAQNILLETFNQPLGVTMGGACIKILQSHLPREIVVKTMPDEAIEITRLYAMRGGFCYCVKRFHGPVWKYDINQAYAAAMRDALLPCGAVEKLSKPPTGKNLAYIAKVTGHNKNNKIPFYYSTKINGRNRRLFATTEIYETWLTSIEIDQLKREGWNLEISTSWVFEKTFNLREYVDKLETLRTTCEGGPSGATGTMVKAVGNHSYGKTVEQNEPINFLLASECPPGFVPYYEGSDVDPIEHIYYQFIDDSEIRLKDYHQPQLGAFITAHVRMVVRRAALLNPGAWLYADTDCVVFSEDMTQHLNIDSKRYGAWKVEESGTVYKIIAKKVYHNQEKDEGHAKGLNVRRGKTKLLTADDFNKWFDGEAPEQTQIQRNNFMKVMLGADMYRKQTRKGTSVEKTQ